MVFLVPSRGDWELWLACCGVQHMLNIDVTGSLYPCQSLASTQPYGPAVSSSASRNDPNAGVQGLEVEG